MKFTWLLVLPLLMVTQSYSLFRSPQSLYSTAQQSVMLIKKIAAGNHLSESEKEYLMEHCYLPTLYAVSPDEFQLYLSAITGLAGYIKDTYLIAKSKFFLNITSKNLITT